MAVVISTRKVSGLHVCIVANLLHVLHHSTCTLQVLADIAVHTLHAVVKRVVLFCLSHTPFVSVACHVCDPLHGFVQQAN